jgi:polyisoprenoid-binding protein YceI
MNFFRYAILALSLVTSTACDNDPGKGKAQAVIGAPVPSAAPAVVAGTSTYPFTNETSKVEFVGAKVTRKHPGSFGGFSGAVTLVDADPKKSSVKVEIDTATLSVDEPKLTNHLKTPDFFDVQKFPKATFTSTSIQSAGSTDAYAVTGNLELHGVSKSITFPAAIKVNPNAVDAYSEFAINRKDFGIVYPGMPDDIIKDDVLIKLSIHAPKK